MRLGWFNRLLGRDETRGLALYEAAVAQARAPHWYLDGAVPDTVDGRFDMIAGVLSLVLLRLEREPDATAALSASVTERFVDDMDGQLRQGGIGDITVGKHVGRMMAMLGGRLGAYRDALAAGTPNDPLHGALDEALVRNLYRGHAPDPAAVAHVRTAMLALADRLAAQPIEALERGALA